MPDVCSAAGEGPHEGSLHEWTIRINGEKSYKIILCKRHERARVKQDTELSDEDCGCRICKEKRSTV